MTYLISGLSGRGLGRNDGAATAVHNTNIWSRAKLREGDSLASLAALYGVTVKEILNGQRDPANVTKIKPIPLDGVAISGDGGWVQSTGGQIVRRPLSLPSGRTLASHWSFSKNSIIWLPPLPLREFVSVNPAPTPGGGAVVDDRLGVPDQRSVDIVDTTTPKKKKSNMALAIGLGVVALLVVAGAGGLAAKKKRSSAGAFA